MQIMQESVTEQDRLSVFGVENALCQFFFVGKDLLAIALPDARTYGLLILVSVGFVLTGFGFYMVYFWKVSAMGKGCSKSVLLLRIQYITSKQKKLFYRSF